MSHHVFRRMLFGGGCLIDWINANLSPLFLLGFDDKVGTDPIEDRSGNGNDFAVVGAPTLEAGESTLLSGALQSADITAGGQKFTRNAVATSGVTWSIVAAYRVDTSLSTMRIYDNILDSGSSTERCVFMQLTGVLRQDWPSGISSITARDIAAVGWEGLLGVTAGGTFGAFYENGLEFARFAVSTGAQSGGNTRTVAWGDYALATADPAYGNHYLGALLDVAMTRKQQYDLWLQVNGTRHYWYATLGALSGATAETDDSPAYPPSDIIFHAPLWESAGGQAIDVSGNENHASYIAGPTLKQAPLGSGEVYSIALNGSTQYVDLPAGAVVDYTTTSFTASCRFTATTNLDCLYYLGSSSSQYITSFTNGDKLVFRYYDGSILKTVTSVAVVTDGVAHGMCIRWDASASTLSGWLDGSLVGSEVAAGTPAAPTNTSFGSSDGGLIGVGALLGNLGALTLANTALPDADCAKLSKV